MHKTTIFPLLGVAMAAGAMAMLAAAAASQAPPSKLQQELTAANARIATLTATNAAVVRGLRSCQAQRNAALDQALNDEMNRP